MVEDLNNSKMSIAMLEENNNKLQKELRDLRQERDREAASAAGKQAMIEVLQKEKDGFALKIEGFKLVTETRDAVIKDLQAELEQVNARAVNFANLLEVAEKKVMTIPAEVANGYIIARLSAGGEFTNDPVENSITRGRARKNIIDNIILHNLIEVSETPEGIHGDLFIFMRADKREAIDIALTKPIVAEEDIKESNSPYIDPVSSEPAPKYKKKVRHGKSGV